MTKRNISESGIALIKQFEGLRLAPYKDVVGKWTVGYGHLMQPGESVTTPLTEEQATSLLLNDVRKAVRCVANAPVTLSQNEFDALVSFTYNLGCGAFTTSTLLKKIVAGDLLGAADEFLKWNHAGGQVVSGLTHRRQLERTLFLTPDATKSPLNQ